MIILWGLALIWIIFATVQDIKTREIFNWLNFSLIIFALGFRFFYSFFEFGGFNFLYQGLIGVGIFFILGELFYYGKMFAGGDEKLLWALGAILPLNISFLSNVKIFVLFLMLFLFMGFLYGLIATIYLSIKHRKAFSKEFIKQFKKNKLTIYLALTFSITLILLSFLNYPFWILGIIVFVLPYLFLFAKSVDESCMIRKLKTTKLTEGDWLYKDVRLGKKKIKATWDGLIKKDIALLKKHKKNVLIRFGIQFAPVFLISFILLLLGFLLGKLDILWNAFW